MTLIFKNTDDETLYEQLVSRIDHIERAFIVRRHIKLHYAKAMPKEVTAEYKKVRTRYNDFFSTFEESLLWFITVELWSRFTANSKRGLSKLANKTNDQTIKQKLVALVEKHQAVIGYINTQRVQYLAHADNVKWKNFPGVFDGEYEALIKDIKDLLSEIGSTLGEQRRPTKSVDYGEDTRLLFDDLLRVLSPGLDVWMLSAQYDSGVEHFLSKNQTSPPKA